ncbi:MAG: apolipoprotein N-acyltransferase [Alphaproteobacteria bacterium]|nr:apolipoprotein N-acyltransferase [Alphaproteobacteria bacterium]
MPTFFNIDTFYQFVTKLTQLRPLHKNSLCVALGTLSAFALPPLSWPILFFVGFGGFVTLLISTTSLKQCFIAAWCWAVGFHLAGLYWISASLFIDITRYLWVLPFSLLALPAYLGLIFGAACCAVYRLRTKPVIHLIALCVVLALCEHNRGWLWGGFPWNLFGYIWADTLPIIQSASLFGIKGLTLLTLLAAASFSFVFKPLDKPAIITLTAIGMVFSGLALWGVQRLETNQTIYHDKVMLRLVQPAIEQSERKTHDQRVAALAKIIRMSAQPAEKPITHIIWPETASPFFLNEDAAARLELKPVVPKGGAILTGSASRVIENGQRKYFNSLVVMNDKGSIIGSYDKSHLVPFGEFVPLRNILQTVPVAVDVIGSGDFTPGTGAKTLRAPGLPPFSTMICYEAIFSGQLVDENDRPQLLLQVTNDAWFGNTSGPYQHLAMARVRAIEEGIPLIRVANSGVSAVVDPLGRIITSLDLNKSGIIDSALPKALETAPYFTKLQHFF